MELTKQEIQKALETDAATAVPDEGATIPRFHALYLAQSLEREIAKCDTNGHTHMRLTMNIADAAALAAFLRRGSIMGV